VAETFRRESLAVDPGSSFQTRSALDVFDDVLDLAFGISEFLQMIAFGITRRIAQPLAPYFALFRPIRIWPTLDKELSDVAGRYEKIIVIEGSDGQYANVVERMLLRRVERVPLLGGRMSIEAIREGLDAIGMLPAELASTVSGSVAHARARVG
jgi:hypothetical protein